jgi:diguanylate cyclase (GGDEF)-like protein/PAS domain S-box-containing protein
MLDELFQTIFLNITIIFGVFLLITTLEFEFFSKNKLGNILTGIVIGFATVITMMNGFVLEAGIVYDARSVVIGVAAFFFPLLASIISTTIAILYRISLGGIGVIPGSLSIFSAFLVGVIYKKITQKHSISKSYYNYYFLGVAIHIFVLLSQLLLPYPRNIELIRIMGPVFLGIYPFATLILCIFMQNQNNRLVIHNQLIESESRLKTIFNESPIAMLVHDCETGEVIAANRFTFDIFKINSVEELNPLLWINEPPFSRKEAVEFIQKAKYEEQNFVWRTKVDNKVYYEQVLLRPIMLEGKRRILSASIDITDKKLAEDDLMKFKSVVTEAEYGAALSDRYGNLVYVNQAFCEMHGYTEEELIGQSIQILHSDHQLDRVNNLLKQLIEVGSFKSEEVWHKRKDGTIFPSIMSATTVFNQEDVTFFSASVMDISNLRLNEQRYRLVSQVSNTGVWEYNINTDFLWCSPEYFSMLGYQQEQFNHGTSNLNDNWTKLIHPDDLKQADEKFKHYIKEKPNHEYENYFRLKAVDGSDRWIWSRGNFVRDENGVSSDIIVGTHIDITASRLQELERIDLENQLKLLISEMPLGLAHHEVIYDEKGVPIDYRHLSINQSFEDFTGLKGKDIIGKTVLEVLPKTEKYWIDFYGKVATTGKAAQFENYAQEFNKYCNVRAYSPKKGEFTVIFEDVTAKKLAEEKIKHASLHDYLTGLPNRRYFDEKVSELDEEKNLPLIIAMLDIDGLKLINDTLGHFSGDQAIIEVAKLLDSCFNESAFASRTGGDEFMIVCSKMTFEEFKQRKNMMLKRISEVKIQDVEISLSFGIAIKEDEQERIEDIIIKAENDMYANKVLHGQSARNKIIVTLFDALKDKYEEERIHSSRVSHFCALMGERLNLLVSERQELELAGRMHDIGKISIPDTILRKVGKLNDDEWAIMKTHTTNGYQILRSADQYSRLAEYALTHHERIDGFGYPQGLKGDEIPLFSRIIAICDAFEAMTTDRKYRKSLSNEEAIAEIQRCSGTQFDSRLVEIFVSEVVPEIE